MALLLGLAYRLVDADQHAVRQGSPGANPGPDEPPLTEPWVPEKLCKLDNAILAPHNGEATWNVRYGGSNSLYENASSHRLPLGLREITPDRVVITTGICGLMAGFRGTLI